jgi:hypothetical protein
MGGKEKVAAVGGKIGAADAHSDGGGIGWSVEQGNADVALERRHWRGGVLAGQVEMERGVGMKGRQAMVGQANAGAPADLGDPAGGR